MAVGQKYQPCRFHTPLNPPLRLCSIFVLLFLGTTCPIHSYLPLPSPPPPSVPAMITFVPLPALPALHPPRLPAPLSAPPRRARFPTCALPRELSVAAVSALTLVLSAQPATPSPTVPPSAQPNPPSIQFVHSSATATAATATTTARPVAIALAATAPIHEYHFQPDYALPPEPPAHSPVHDSLHETRTELLLAARLITAVLLGVMVGVERRATRLRLGVRSITIISLTSALISVVAMSTRLTSTTAAALSTATVVSAPATAIVAASIAVAAAVFGAGRITSHPLPRHETMPMSVVVGIVVAMGGACGAGLSLMSAASYLAAIAIMRGTEANKNMKLASNSAAYAVTKDRELRVESDDGWDGENRMVFRIGRGKNTDTRVVEIGRKILPDGRLELKE